MFINYSLLLSLGLMWGGSYAATKIAVASLAPIWVACLRLGLAAFVLIALCVLFRERRLEGRIWLWCCVMGFVGVLVPFFLISWGQQYVDSGLAAILVAFTPLATVALAHFFTRDEKLTVRRLGGFCLGFGGICILLGPDALMGFAFWGVALAAEAAIVCGAVLFAVNTLLGRFAPKAPLLGKSAALNGLGAMMALPFAASAGAPGAALLSWELSAAVVFLALFPTALATLAWWKLIARAGAGFTAYGNYLAPLVGVCLGIAAMGERLGADAFIALALILGGLALAGNPRVEYGLEHNRRNDLQV